MDNKYKVSRGVIFDLLQGCKVPIGIRGSLIDPVDKGLFVPDDEKISVELSEASGQAFDPPIMRSRHRAELGQ